MTTTPLSERLKIVFFGLRNSGKSSLLNHLFEKEIAIVSETPGTTTDTVTRTMELGKLGPVAIIDTAGIDDTGDLGELRVQKTTSTIETADVLVLVSKASLPPANLEKEILKNMLSKNKKIVFALTFADQESHPSKLEWAKKFSFALIDNIHKTGILDLKKALIDLADQMDVEITPVEGLVRENDLVVLVTPIDLAAPKGRLILPQVETIRDLLDKDCGVLVVKERELKYFYDSLKIKPKLVVTDSQAFHKVAADIPEDQMLTSFSILFARKKGDLSFFLEGVQALKNVPEGSKILILEACSHHRQADDLGSVKIPRLFQQLIPQKVSFDFARELPPREKLREYFLAINCAGCMVTRAQMLSRLKILKENGVAATNYGLFLAWANGLLPRAIAPF
jgi:[FeFe] hydrogenase H-cluster maturation GTPase HydF